MSIFRLLFCSIVLICSASEVLYAQPAYILHTETGHLGGISNTKFTSDGKFIISSAFRDSSLLIWDGETGNYLYSINTHPNFPENHNYEPRGITSFEISNDSRLVVAATNERTLHIIDLIQKKEIWTETFASNIIRMRFSPTSDSLLAIEDSGDVHLIDLKTPLSTRVTKINVYEYSKGVAISASLRYIAYPYNRDTVAVKDIIVDTIAWGSGHRWQAGPILVENDSLLITTDGSDTIVVWDAKTLEFLRSYNLGPVFTDHIVMYPGIGNSIIYIPLGRYSPDTIYALNVLTGGLKVAINTSDISTTCIGVSSDEKKIVVGSEISLAPVGQSQAGIVSLYSNEKDTLIRQLTTTHELSTASFSGNGKFFSINGGVSHITLLNSEEGDFVRCLNGMSGGGFESDGSCYGGDLSDDGRFFVYSEKPTLGQWDYRIYVNRTDSSKPVVMKHWNYNRTWNFKWMEGDSSLLFMRDLSYNINTIHSLSLKGVEREFKFITAIKLYDYDYLAGAGIVAMITSGMDSIYCVSLKDSSIVTAFSLVSNKASVIKLSPVADKVLTIEKNTSAVLYDVTTGVSVKTFTVAGTSIRDIAYCSNGKYVLTGHSDSSLRVWDIATGLPVFRYDSLGGVIVDIDISGDGSRILACTDNRFVHLLQGIDELGVKSPPLSSSTPKMLVYPNPTSSAVMLMRENDEASDVLVYDQTGKMYYKDKVTKGITRITIPTQSLAAGSYLVKIGGETASFIVAR